MSEHLKVIIAETSPVIRCGLEVQLKRLSGLRLQLIEVADAEFLYESMRMHKPDMLIINPSMQGCFSLQHLKEETGCPHVKCIALLYALADPALLRLYDEQISIYDSADEIKRKLEHFDTDELPELPDTDEQQMLSVREKEIVVCVVKGMTNREIATRLFLSTHTVITHRRNIARKLQIHSASGLTVYAIVNKLIELSDIDKQQKT
ncbi:MAG: response regulator transcription factor [Tannerellaceae bacterium]|jgi:DNA-binding NarL/FixJ family response regulator|nr:response regulator transcription factor [Tannerellaceae bacterium]